jgi:transposase InsO family protein
LGKSRQAFYKQINQQQGKMEITLNIVEDIRQQRQEQPRIGTIKLYETLKDKWQHSGIKIGRDKLYNILSEHQLLIRYRKRKPRTTWSNHNFRVAPDLFKDYEAIIPGQMYVSDITYVPLNNGKFCYLFLITDAYSKYIVGYKLAKTMHAYHAIEALDMAQQCRTYGQTTIHHSDRGIQYCCTSYVNRLKQFNYIPSNTQSSDPRDNSIAERVNGILKYELILPFNDLDNFQQAARRVKIAIETYNNKRIHMSCNLKTPNEIQKMKCKAKKRWKSNVVNQKQLLNLPVNLSQ